LEYKIVLDYSTSYQLLGEKRMHASLAQRFKMAPLDAHKLVKKMHAIFMEELISRA
jgi:hypothetical protein